MASTPPITLPSEVEHRGTVTAFDGEVGLGEVTPHCGGRALPFHCVAIADGTRHIDVGTEVRFQVMAKLGRIEATAIVPADR